MSTISVLIPTYNRPYYLKQALESVLNQTRLPDEIIIGDDNPESEENYNAIKGYLTKYPFIKYVKNKKNLGSTGNYRALFEKAKGDYIKWLADDDILLPDALEKLSYYLDRYPEVKLATSMRRAVDYNLKELNNLFMFKVRLFEEDTIVDGKSFVIKSLKDLFNYGGEFSTYMFRKKDVYFDLFKIEDLEFKVNSDWFMWIMLARTGKVAYISKPLSLFRLTRENEQCNPDIALRGFKETFFFITHNFFNTEFPLTYKEKLKQLSIFIYGFLKLNSYMSLKDEDKKNRLQNLIQNAKTYNISLYKKEKRQPVSIITVTYNCENVLDKYLSSVLSSIEEDDEVIIVDNASTDNTRNILKKINHKNVKLIFNLENYGYSKAVNIGIKASKNPYVIFLNPDTVVYKGWIESLQKHFTSEDTGAVAPISNYSALYQNFYLYCKEISEFNLPDEELIYLYIKDKNYGKSIESKLLLGFCIITRREILEKIGYLDEELFLGNDDLEFSWRLRENGYKLKIAIDTFIYHKGHESFNTLKEESAEKLVQESTNKLADKLIKYYGYGNVPHPNELWNIDWFIPVGEKYKYMFKIESHRPDLNKTNLDNEKVAVILVNYKTVDHIFENIKSLYNQTFKNLSIVVVDNSEEDTYIKSLYQMLKNEGFNVSLNMEEDIDNIHLKFNRDIVLIKSKENLGFSGGNNLGIKVAKKNKASYIWILNPDTTAVENTLEEMLKTSKIYNSPIVSCKIKDFYHRENIHYDGIRIDLKGVPDRPDIIKKPKVISGANILMRADTIEKIGYWDEDFFLYFEDNYFLYRVINENIFFLYTPFTHIYHKVGRSTGGFLNSIPSIYYYSRNIFLIEEKLEEFNFEASIKHLLTNYDKLKNKKSFLKAMFLGIYDFLLGVKGRKENLNQIVKNREYIGKLYGDEKLDSIFIKLFEKPRDKKLAKKFFKTLLELLEEKYSKQHQSTF